MENLFVPDNTKFIHVDEWIMREKDIIVTHTKGYMIIPISKMLKLKNCEYLDTFSLSIKKGYNSEKSRIRVSRYINYFLKFYDEDKELIYIYYKIKFLIDCYTSVYDDQSFIYDICKYFLSPSMKFKINEMNDDNYCIKLAVQKYKKEVLRYSDKHGKLLLKLSLIFKLIMPLVTHYMFKKRIPNNEVQNFLLKVYDKVIGSVGGDVDIFMKLYETAISNIENNAKTNPIWEKQEIRGINQTIHALNSIRLIIVDIIIKYIYSMNIVIMNFQTIRRMIKYQVTECNFEMDFHPLSSIADKNMQDDNNATSQFDRYENTLTKENEALYIQNTVNCEETMRYLSSKYQISKDEIVFYVRRLIDGNKFKINPFQLNLIFLLFDNVFGDTVSTNAINRTDYIKLLIISKKVLLNHGLKLLPYIISGKIIKLVEKKDVTVKQRKKIESSQTYPIIQNKYKNPKIEEIMRSIIGTVLSSEFEIIDYYNKNIDGIKLDLIEDIVIEEILIYISLI